MSKYRVIKTQYRNLDSLKKALWGILGIHYDIALDYKNPDLPMYGYMNDLRPETASIVIRRQWLNKNWSRMVQPGFKPLDGASNDIGFAWDGQQFVVIVSDYDSHQPGVIAGLQQLNQDYSYLEVMRLARENGYLIKRRASVDGKMRVVIQKG